MTRIGNVVSALAEQRGAPGLPLPKITKRKRSRSEQIVYPIEVRVSRKKLHCGTYHTLEEAKVARDCVTCVTADYVPEKCGYRFQEIPSICKSLPNWEPLCRDLRKVSTEGSSKLIKLINHDIKELVKVVIRKVSADQIPSSRAANGIRQPASDVETTEPLQSLKQVTGTPGTTRGHRETPVAGHSQQHASRDVEVDDVLSVREHQSNGKLSGPLNSSIPQAIAESVRGFTCEQHEVFLRNLPDVVKQTISTVLAYDPSDAAASQSHINENSSDEKTPQAIAENMRGFTRKQHEVFLLNLPDMVKRFYLSRFPAYYPSQGARFFSDAAASQFQNSFDEKIPQTIAERVRGFTCEQLQEFLLKLPDMVKLFFLTMLLPCYPSQSARISSDAAASQFHMDENTLDEKTSQAIAESVRGFTCEQHGVFLRNLPDVVKRFSLTMPAYYPSQADRFCSDAATPQFHIDENQRTDNVLTAGGRSQSPEIYGRTASTITSYKWRGKVVQELENLNEAPTDREEWVTPAELWTELIRYQGRNWVLYDDLDRPVDALEPSFHNVNPAVNFCSYSPTSSHTVPTSSRPVSRCLSVNEEDIYRELSQRQKPPAGDTDMEIVRERTALLQEGSGDAHHDYGDWTFD